jgi:hypothetical protein
MRAPATEKPQIVVRLVSAADALNSASQAARDRERTSLDARIAAVREALQAGVEVLDRIEPEILTLIEEHRPVLNKLVAADLNGLVARYPQFPQLGWLAEEVKQLRDAFVSVPKMVSRLREEIADVGIPQVRDQTWKRPLGAALRMESWPESIRRSLERIASWAAEVAEKTGVVLPTPAGLTDAARHVPRGRSREQERPQQESSA